MQGESMFGHGTAYWVNREEIAHFEGVSEIDIRLTRDVIRERRAALKSDDRVLLRPSGADWITVHFETGDDLDFVASLVELAAQAHRPPPGVPVAPPPSGPQLGRLKRSH
jgi:hypothetical protein